MFSFTYKLEFNPPTVDQREPSADDWARWFILKAEEQLAREHVEQVSSRKAKNRWLEKAEDFRKERVNMPGRYVTANFRGMIWAEVDKAAEQWAESLENLKAEATEYATRLGGDFWVSTQMNMQSALRSIPKSQTALSYVRNRKEVTDEVTFVLYYREMLIEVWENVRSRVLVDRVDDDFGDLAEKMVDFRYLDRLYELYRDIVRWAEGIQSWSVFEREQENILEAIRKQWWEASVRRETSDPVIVRAMELVREAAASEPMVKEDE